jgi:hypothetical protein
MLKHITVSDQVKSLTHGVAPVRAIQVQRQHTRAEFTGLFRSFRVNFNAHHT